MKNFGFAIFVIAVLGILALGSGMLLGRTVTHANDQAEAKDLLERLGE
jgi:hypothetical protein